MGARKTVHITAALAALWLTACGGGGGDAPAPVASNNNPGAPAPAPGAGSPAPAPGAGSPAPAPAPAAVLVSSDTQLAANTSYSVNGTGTGPINLTLPASAGLNIGDTVSIAGASANPWVVAQNAGQSILTANLSGNVAPGTNWTPALTPKVWHWVASNATGEVLVAGEGVGGTGGEFLNTSSDGGVTWTTGDSPGNGGTWISADMSASGDRIVAAQYGGGLFMSTDKGVTWTRVTGSPLVDSTSGVSFESVTMSTDGQHLAAVIQNGPIVISNDAGASWTAATLPTTTQTRPWRGIDSSSDGTHLVAVSQDGDVFTSTDSGATWTGGAITAGTPAAPVFENWYRVKMSADGSDIAIAGNSFGGTTHTGIYMSHDGGATWTRTFNLDTDYTALAMSADGQVVGATLSDTTGTPGRVLLSTDGGANFNPLTLPGSDTNWRAMAMSADGNKLAVAAGLFTTGTTGQLYTSLGNRTSVGTGGAITGGQNQSVQLKYEGNGQFSVQNSAGGAFTIR